jgi:hypothetical protein
MAWGGSNMQRFRLLGFYLVGVLGVVGLAVWGVSLRRSAAGAPQPSGVGASQGSSTTAATGAAPVNLAFAVRNIFAAKCVECHGSDLPRPKGRFGYVLDLERLATMRTSWYRSSRTNRNSGSSSMMRKCPPDLRRQAP